MLRVTCCCCILIAVSSIGHAADFQPSDPGPYLSVLGGWVGVGDLDTTEEGLEGRTEFDPGFGILGALGYDFGITRVEGELGYQTSGLDRVVVAGTSAHMAGHFAAATMMANGYLDLRGSVPLVPYLTAGIGVGSFELEYSGRSKHDVQPVGQVGAGAAWVFNKHWSLDVRARYIAALGDLQLGVDDMEFHAAQILIGLRYGF